MGKSVHFRRSACSCVFSATTVWEPRRKCFVVGLRRSCSVCYNLFIEYCFFCGYDCIKNASFFFPRVFGEERQVFLIKHVKCLHTCCFVLFFCYYRLLIFGFTDYCYALHWMELKFQFYNSPFIFSFCAGLSGAYKITCSACSHAACCVICLYGTLEKRYTNNFFFCAS